MTVEAILKAHITTQCELPLFLEPVSAGFPSPADDYIEKKLDLNEFIIKHPAATFFVRVNGDSMCNAGIQSGDLLVVDRAVKPASGKIVVAILNGEFTVKRLEINPRGFVRLLPENPAYPAVEIHADVEFQVWGVVTHVIHRT